MRKTRWDFEFRIDAALDVVSEAAQVAAELGCVVSGDADAAGLEVCIVSSANAFSDAEVRDFDPPSRR
jgi:hypothetical protein